VIRTPSSRFDAASSGGIINIVLKKGYKIGRFGTVNTGMNQGALSNRFAGINLNNSGDKSAYYLNISYNYNALEESLNSLRILAAERNLQQSAITRSFSNQGYTGYGISYDFTDRLVLNYDGRINASLPRSSSNNSNIIESLESVLLSENDNRISNNSKSLNLQQEAGIKYKLDTIGSEWDTRFSYNFNSSSASQEYATNFLFPGNSMFSGFGDNNQHRHFMTLQSDLTLTFPGHKILETGLKSSYQKYFSDADYYINRDGVTLPDGIRTNAFNYNEFINSAYMQASAPLPGDLLLKAGLRLEQTYMNGFQTIPADTSFLVNRVDLFPYVFLSRRVIEIAGYEMRGYMIYRRSINRPNFQNLNPYHRFVDQYFFETGNPALEPQFTENYEANISFDEIPIFAVGRSYVQDIFSQVIYQDKNDSNVAVRTYDNVGRNRETYFRMAGAIPPGKKYFFVVGAQYNHNVYEGIYENQPLSFTRGSWRLFTFHSLNLGKQTRLTMSGFMMLKGQQNFYELNTIGMLNFGLSHSILDRKLTISLNARDVFRTMETQFSLNQGAMPASGIRYSDTQRIGVNIRYNFGIRNKPERERSNMFDFDNGE
jgi:iron complex outermembrane recepter protein